MRNRIVVFVALIAIVTPAAHAKKNEADWLTGKIVYTPRQTEYELSGKYHSVKELNSIYIQGDYVCISPDDPSTAFSRRQ